MIHQWMEWNILENGDDLLWLWWVEDVEAELKPQLFQDTGGPTMIQLLDHLYQVLVGGQSSWSIGMPVHECWERERSRQMVVTARQEHLCRNPARTLGTHWHRLCKIDKSPRGLSVNKAIAIKPGQHICQFKSCSVTLSHAEIQSADHDMWQFWEDALCNWLRLIAGRHIGPDQEVWNINLWIPSELRLRFITKWMQQLCWSGFRLSASPVSGSGRASFHLHCFFSLPLQPPMKNHEEYWKIINIHPIGKVSAPSLWNTNHHGTPRIWEVREVSAKSCKSAWDAVRQQSSISFNVRCFLWL